MAIINEKYIIDERKQVIFNLKNKGYDNATIAKIMFNTNRSNITMFFKKWSDDFRKYIIDNN